MKRKLEVEEGATPSQSVKSKKIDTEELVANPEDSVEPQDEVVELEDEIVEEIVSKVEEKIGDEVENEKIGDEMGKDENSELKEEAMEEEITEPIQIDFDTADLVVLLENYGASLKPQDLEIFERLSHQKKKEIECLPLFGPRRSERFSKISNPLLAHSGKANALLTFLNHGRAFSTAIQYDSNMKNAPNPGGFYDLRFLLPVLCHSLDEKNVCDVVKVVQNGWIYLMMRGLSLENAALRKASLLAFKRFMFNLQQPKLARNLDVKIWLHFLYAIKRGIGQLEECRISNLLSTWLVAAWEVIRQPAHPMFNRLTSFLLAKPVLEMTILPEFISFYNPSDGNRDSREWVLNVLYWGLKSAEDWKIVQKLPTIKFLCSSFMLEKLKTRKNIAGILFRGADIPEVAQVMIEKYGIPLWISNIVTMDTYLQNRTTKLLELLKTHSTSNPARDLLFQFVTQRIEQNKIKAAASSKVEPQDIEDAVKNERSESNGIPIEV